jgi:hypothetical protein
VWITDCDGPDPAVTAPSVTQALGGDARGRVEKLLGRKCHGVTHQRRPVVTALDCAKDGPLAQGPTPVKEARVQNAAG